MSEEWMGLAEAVTQLRAELSQAQSEGKDEALQFELGPVEMEFLLELRKEVTGNATFKFWVVSAGGTGAASRGSTHRVMLTLTPKEGDRTPLIRGVDQARRWAEEHPDDQAERDRSEEGQATGPEGR